MASNYYSQNYYAIGTSKQLKVIDDELHKRVEDIIEKSEASEPIRSGYSSDEEMDNGDEDDEKDKSLTGD
jgi:hypothetical protein